MTGKQRGILLLFILFYFIDLVIALKIADVARVGNNLAEIGLSTVNEWFRGLWHYDETSGYIEPLYIITEIMGYIALAPCVLWTVLLIREFVEAKSLSGVGVDKSLFAIVFLYVLTAIVCLIFRLAPVNFRPVQLPGQTYPEVSFPSDHVVLFIVSMGSTMFRLGDVFEGKKNLVLVLRLICGVFMATGIIFRLICGVNWCTDIAGGMLLGTTLILLFSFFYDV